MRKHAKKFLSLTLALCLALALLPTAALAAGNSTSGTFSQNLTWSLQNGVLTIGGTGDMEDAFVSNDQYLGDYCPPWSDRSETIRSIVLKDGVTGIGDHAFYKCTALTSVDIPNSVTRIGEWAFYGCTGLTSVTIPNSVTEIGCWAFEGCTALTSVTISNRVTEIQSGTFSRCTALTSVDIPDGVATIMNCAFSGCTALTSVNIPGSVKSIVGDIENGAFQDCTSLASVTIPDGVSSIGMYAFHGCTSLTNIDFPASVTEVSSEAFDGTPWLKNQGELVLINGTLLRYQGSGGHVTIPDGVTTISSDAFSGCTGLTGVDIPDSVTSIGYRAFSGCTGLTGVDIPDSVTSIGFGAFSNCSNLASVTLPDGDVMVESSAFDGTPWLKSLGDFAIIGGTLLRYQGSASHATIPDGVTSIGYGAFDDCMERLTSVTIPTSVTRFESFMAQVGSAFDLCENLKDIYYTGSEEQWKKISKGLYGYGDDFTSAAIHFNSTGPSTPNNSAVPTNDKLTMDGKSYVPAAYKISNANYFKLRDVAMMMNGTAGQFSVDYDETAKAIRIVTGQPYSPIGGELGAAPTQSAEALPSNDTVYINGEKVELAAYKIDGGVNFYGIRDLASRLGFNVGWTAERGMYIESDKPYTDAD